MNYAGRMNSFVLKGENVFDAIHAYHQMNGITHLEFNYPEHIVGYDLEEIKKEMGDLKVNGFAVRWRDRKFLNGNFTNPNPDIRKEAIQYCKDAADTCRELGGSVLTVWLENDGFDYSFQMNYAKMWKRMIDAFREVADYAPDMKISIEYKPFEERNFALLDSAGMVMYMLDEIDRENVGCTLDFCHMLMKHDNPSYGLALAAEKKKLFGLHMNDGYGWQDSGLIFGSVSIPQAAEFIYYLKKYKYDGVVFFDTFPIREEAKLECQANIDAFEKIYNLIDTIGMDKFDEVVSRQDGISAQSLILEMIR
ncbi:MAG: sugar phosphate isomerase/epimerase [Lachnospiraceae bacterium]|nr:sugar phosphate isomerase/epimerase [Lachnospiraceae bacterium]